MKCRNCKYWQCPNGLRNTREWSDCNHVIATLIPDFHELKNRFGFNLSIPFSPHDTKYLLERIPRPHDCDIPAGVRIQSVKEKDTAYDDDGNERTKIIRLDFYQTHKDYYCGWEEL